MAKKRTSKADKRPRGRRGGLASASVSELRAEMDRRRRELRSRRQTLEKEIASIDLEIAALDGHRPASRRSSRPAGGGKSTPKRPRNEKSLVESLRTVLADRTMSVAEMAEAVQKAGYRTSSPNFRTIVNQTLIGNKGTFKRVARGQYAAH